MAEQQLSRIKLLYLSEFGSFCYVNFFNTLRNPSLFPRGSNESTTSGSVAPVYTINSLTILIFGFNEFFYYLS